MNKEIVSYFAKVDNILGELVGVIGQLKTCVSVELKKETTEKKNIKPVADERNQVPLTVEKRPQSITHYEMKKSLTVSVPSIKSPIVTRPNVSLSSSTRGGKMKGIGDGAALLTGKEGIKTLFESQCRLLIIAKDGLKDKCGICTLKIVVDVAKNKTTCIINQDDTKKLVARFFMDSTFLLRKGNMDRVSLWACVNMSGREKRTASMACYFIRNEDSDSFCNIAAVAVASCQTNRPSENSGTDLVKKNEECPIEKVIIQKTVVKPTVGAREKLLLNAVCKLYNANDNTCILRGTGNFKVFINELTAAIRCELPEVVNGKPTGNLIISFMLTPGMNIKQHDDKHNAVIWSCVDFSDPSCEEGDPVTLICRFKNASDANTFRSLIVDYETALRECFSKKE